MSATRLILVPGMGADERLFGAQSAGGLTFDVAPFPIPARRDDMAAYAARIARLMDLDENCVLGGVSFGGMVAAEMARIVRPRAVIQIASCMTRQALPGYYTAVEWVSRIVPDVLVKRRAKASSRMLALLESLSEEQAQLIRDMSMRVPIPFLRRVGRMIVRWKGVSSLPCPVYQIHGGKDRIIPLRHVRPTQVVRDGGHLINMTHADAVNGFIQRYLEPRSTEVA